MVKTHPYPDRSHPLTYLKLKLNSRQVVYMKVIYQLYYRQYKEWLVGRYLGPDSGSPGLIIRVRRRSVGRGLCSNAHRVESLRIVMQVRAMHISIVMVVVYIHITNTYCT